MHDCPCRTVECPGRPYIVEEYVQPEDLWLRTVKCMSLNWKTVRAEHVSKACGLLVAKGSTATKGIVVWHNQQTLPAKQVLRIAYRLANDLPDNREVKFSSGEPTLRLLVALGFHAERIVPQRAKSDEGEPG
jgi:hypothetical protein